MELGFYTEENNPISLSPTLSFSLWPKLKNHNFLCNQTTKKSQTTPGKNKLGFLGDQPKEYTAIRTPKFAFLHQILTELKRPKPHTLKKYIYGEPRFQIALRKLKININRKTNPQKESSDWVEGERLTVPPRPPREILLKRWPSVMVHNLGIKSNCEDSWEHESRKPVKEEDSVCAFENERLKGVLYSWSGGAQCAPRPMRANWEAIWALRCRFETQGSPIQINNWVGPVDPDYSSQARFVCMDLISVRVQIYSGSG